MRHQPKQSDRTGATRIGNGGFAKLNRGEYRRPAIARRVEDGASCCECGWPFKPTSSVMLSGRTETGDTKYKHAMCPSLRERRLMRAEALSNA